METTRTSWPPYRSRPRARSAPASTRTMGAEKALEFSAGYVVEQSLSVDNLLVFLVLFEYFKVPPGPMQDKALAYGLYGAVVCRAIFVGLGAVALAEFRGVLLVFAGILLATSAKILLGGEEDEDDDPSKNAIVRWVNSQSLVPATDASMSEDPSRFFTIDSQGIRRATPLLAAVACLELSDVVFAVDSVPAVLGSPKTPYRVHVEHVRHSGVAGVVRRARARGAGARVPRRRPSPSCWGLLV